FQRSSGIFMRGQHTVTPRCMGAAVAIFLVFLLLSSAVVFVGCVMAWRLVPEGQQILLQHWLVASACEGLGIRFAIWVLMTLGLSWQLQPFMPQVQAARYAGLPWFPDFLKVLGLGLLVVSSYWTATTLAWTLVRTAGATDPERRKDL